MNDHPKFQTTAFGELLLNFGEYGREIEVAAFSGDGRRLLTVHDVGTAHVWDTESRELLQEIRPKSPLDGTDVGPTTSPFQTFIESAALNPDGSLALLGLNDGSACVFSTKSAERMSRVKEPHLEPEPACKALAEERWEVIRAVCFSPDGTLIAIGHFDRRVSIWDGIGKRFIQHLRPLSSQRFVSQGAQVRGTLVSSVGISSNNRYVFAGSADGVACIWDMESNSIVLNGVEHAAKIIEMFVSDACVRWATSDGTVWQADRNSPPRKILETGQNWWTAVFSPSGVHLLTRTGGEEIDRWSLDGHCERLAVFDAGVRFRDDLRPFAFGNAENEFCHLKAEKTLVLHQADSSLEFHCHHKFDQMLFSAEHRLLVTEGWADQAELWSIADEGHKRVLACPGGVCSMALSHDGRLLACGASGSGSDSNCSPISIFRVADGKLVIRLEGHEHQVHGLAFGPDDKWLISTSLDRSVRKWDLSTEAGAESKRLVDRDLEFHYINILSDGRVLLFFRRGLEVWDSLDERLLEIPAPIGFRCRVAITPDERHVLLTTDDHIEEWSLTSGSLVRRIQSDMLRPLHFPTRKLSGRIRAQAGANVWQYSGQNFIHVGDGPRGWVTPMSLSVDGQLIVLPCADGAAIVTVDKHPKLISIVPFKGKLRASWFTGEKAKLVNSAGQLFTWNRTDDNRNLDRYA